MARRWDVVAGRRWHAVEEWPAREAGPPVVLVHGYGVSSSYLAPLTLAIAAGGQRAIAPDLPGFGRSERPRRALDTGELARALEGWLAALALDRERPVLLGNSYGCQVVAELAARRPGPARAVVLVGPTVDPATRPAWRLALRLLRDVPREPPAIVPLQIPDYLRAGPRRALATARHALAFRIEARIPALVVPTLVVHGERDPLVSDAWCRWLVDRLPQGELAVVRGGAHAVHYSHPAEVASIVRGFLRRRLTAPAPEGMTR